MKTLLTSFYYNSKQLLSNKTADFMLILFPIIIILILGSALSSTMGSTQLEVINVAAIDASDELISFLQGDDMKDIVKVDLFEKEQDLPDNNYTAVIIQKDDNIEMNIASSDTNVQIIYHILDGYQKVNNAVEIIISEDYKNAVLLSELDLSTEVISVKGLNNRIPGAMDYYAVTMTVMIALYAGLNMVETIETSLMGDMGRRLSLTTCSKIPFLTGIIMSAAVTSFLQTIISVAFSGIVYGAYWGDSIIDIFSILGVYLILNIFSNAAALFMLMITRSGKATSGFFFGFSWVSTFLSQGYMKVDFGAAEEIFKFLPNSLAQNAIFNIIYEGNTSTVTGDVLIITAVAAILLLISIPLLGRRYS